MPDMITSMKDDEMDHYHRVYLDEHGCGETDYAYTKDGHRHNHQVNFGIVSMAVHHAHTLKGCGE